MIRLGYVGINTQLPSASQTFRLANFTEEKMLEIAASNLENLLGILRWNLAHGIHLFRITSHLIPFGSSPINNGSWKVILREKFLEIGDFIKSNQMRVSLHPGQYTVLNSKTKSFFQNALLDLQYHADVLELLGLDGSHKIVLHGGAAYGDKKRAINILEKRFANLPKIIRNRLALENDERIFNAADIWKICQKTGAPAVLDIFHHQVLPSLMEMPIRGVVEEFGRTWKNERQKIHFSAQEIGKRKGAHAESINLLEFERFYQQVADMELDIMLEVKDKEKSLLRIRERFPEIG
jgi:UV DNA damage endonuclease